MDDAERTALAEQYADGAKLKARIALHERHEVADRDWWPWVFDRYDDVPAGAAVLEVGCGTAELWRATADRVPPGWDLHLTDFSPGMAADARSSLHKVGADGTVGVAAAESLPFPDDSLDAVLANHMLYHTDRDRSLPEIERVLRPGGRLYATTNGESNMAELRALLRETTDYEPSRFVDFTLENGGEQLSRVFESVECHEREAALRVPDLEPLVAYAASLPDVDEAGVERFADLADERLADGPFEVGKRMGMFVAQAP